MRIIPGFDEGGVGKITRVQFRASKTGRGVRGDKARDGARRRAIQRQRSRQPILEIAAAWDGDIVTPWANLLPFGWIEG